MRTHRDRTDIGQRIQLYRAARGMTRRALAEAAEVSVSYLGDVERGARKISDKALARVVVALRVTQDELAGEGVDEVWEAPFAFPEPADRFAIIRRELDLLEAECRGTKLT